MAWFVTLALVAGVLAVDHRAGWQGLIAHPVFASLLVGSLFGEVGISITAGLAIELVYLSIVPMRGGRTIDPVAAGVVGSGTAALLARHSIGGDPSVVCAMAVFLGLVSGELGARLGAPLFAFHNRMLCAFEFPAGMEGRRIARRLSLIHAGSVAFIFIVEGLCVLLLGPLAFHTGRAATRISQGATVQGTAYWSVLVLAIGIASIIHLFWRHRFRLWLAVLAGLVVILQWIG